MRVRCWSCSTFFDDADSWNFCPHELLMIAPDLAQKELGLSLIGRDICFAHEPNGPRRRVQSVGWNGMVTLRDMSGEFAPSLFVAAPAPAHNSDDHTNP